MRQTPLGFYLARRGKVALTTFAIAALIVGCSPVSNNRAAFDQAPMQTDADSRPPKVVPKSVAANSPLRTKPVQSFRPAAENTGDRASNSGVNRGSIPANDGQFSLATSRAEHKVYISQLFRKSEKESSLRQDAISFSRERGNTIVALNWKP
jgi:hypothetical protein